MVPAVAATSAVDRVAAHIITMIVGGMLIRMMLSDMLSTAIAEAQLLAATKANAAAAVG